MKTATTEALEVERDVTRQVDAHEGASAWHDEPLPRTDGFPLFARSPVMRELLAVAGRAANSTQLVCLVGEAGTGREVLAREIHRLGGGDASAFVTIDCLGRRAEELDRAVAAALASAGRATVYLAHLAEMPLESQARLARAVRDGQSAGRTRFAGALDVAVVAALEDGRLLPELAELILPIEVPSLRQRKLDVPLLADHLLRQTAERRGLVPRAFSRAAGSLLSALPWPGNTPELAAIVESVAGSVDRPVVELDDVLGHVRLASYTDRSEAGMTLRKAREQFERECISAALSKHRGRMADAAQALGIQRTNLYRKIRQLKVPRAGKPTAR